MPKDLYRIGITGSYGGLNLGDEAILQSIVAQLRKDLPVEITVFSRDAEDTKRRHGVERAIPVRNLSRGEIVPEIERLDLLLLGGGGILYDAEARTYLREVQIARDKGVPVMVYAVGAGPLNDPVSQAAVRDALEHVEAITVRERPAQQALEHAGVHRDITVTADPALLLKPAPVPRGVLKHEGLEGRRRLIGMSVREPGVAAPDLDPDVYHGLLANAADYMVDRFGADVVFVPMERDDIRHAHAVASHMADAGACTVLRGASRPQQVLDIVKRLDLAIGMRLHFLVFAALAGVPLLPLPYAGKVFDFAQQIGAPALRGVTRENVGLLLAEVDRLWDERPARLAETAARTAAMRTRADRTAERFLTYLETIAPSPVLPGLSTTAAPVG